MRVKRPEVVARRLRTAFEISFKVTVDLPGVTQSEIEAHVAEMLRYANGAFVFKVRHPTGDRDRYRRKKNCQLTIGTVAETGKP